MELHQALVQIAEIRQQVARTEVFRGYRALPVAFSGLLAFVAAMIQSVWLPVPTRDPAAYLLLWFTAAALSIVATGIEMAWQIQRSSSSLERDKTLLAVTQFLPCLMVGALLGMVLLRYAPESIWMLPGLWANLFGLGIFASWRLLPKAVFYVGIYYVVAGMLCLIWAGGEAALSPWAMGLPFGLGQLGAAAILYWTLEYKDEQA